MWLLLVVFLAIAALVVGCALRTVDRTRGVRYRVKMLGDAFTATAFAIFTGFALLASVWSSDWSTATLGIATLLCFALAGIIHFLNRVEGVDECRKPTRFLCAAARLVIARASSRAHLIYRELVPSRRRDVRLFVSFFNDLFAARGLGLFYGVSVGLGIVAAIVMLVVSFNSLEDTNNVAISTFAGYWFLLITSCFTVSMLLVAVLVWGVNKLSGVAWNVSLRLAVHKLASAAGIGTAVGAIVGSLAVPVAIFVPNGTDALSPQILVEYAALGALVGFLFGHFSALFSLNREANDVRYRVGVAPAMLISCVAGFAQFGLNPRALLENIAVSFRGRVQAVDATMNEDQITEAIEHDWRAVVILLDDYSSSAFPDAGGLVILVLVSVSAMLVVALGREILRANRAITARSTVIPSDA